MNGKAIPLDSITLRKGAHSSRQSGVCLMEAAAWYGGETHSDSPACVSPWLVTIGRAINDALPDDQRIRLLQAVPLVVGTRDDGMDSQREALLLDWQVRRVVPYWLHNASYADDAQRLAALPRITEVALPPEASALLREVNQKRAAAWEAAWEAAWAAAWEAAWEKVKALSTPLNNEVIDIYLQMCRMRPDAAQSAQLPAVSDILLPAEALCPSI